MSRADAFSVGTMGLIVVVVIVSGPVVPMVDFTTSPISAALESTGETSVEITTTELRTDEFRITPGEYDWQALLEVPPLQVQLSRVSGQPFLVYEVAIADLGRNVATLAVISERDSNRKITITMDPVSIRKQQISDQSYSASVQLRVRSGNSSTTVFMQNVTIRVEGLDEG